MLPLISLMKVLKFVLTNSYFGFRTEMFRQIESIFIDGLEKVLASIIEKPLWWKTFIVNLIA